MTDKVRHVDARFGGKQVRFALPEGSTALGSWAEFRIGQSAFTAFQTFGAGTWDVRLLSKVLSAAHPDGSYGMPPEVERVISVNPPADYAPLAVKVLEAYLFGVPESVARFDEDNPFPQASAA